MTINVRVTGSTTNVRVSSNNPSIKTTVASGVIMPRVLNDLFDVDTTGIQDKYVIMYDSATSKYIAVNPDAVLSASSTTETTQPGLPADFVNMLDIDLDDRIDLDAGTF